MKAIRMHFLLLPLLLVCCIGSTDGEQKASSVRLPAVAGQFYPSDPDRLKLAVQQFLEDALPATIDRPVAIVVPHAGYLYSGQIAADGYRQVKGKNYDTIVILGTNHGRNQAS